MKRRAKRRLRQGAARLYWVPDIDTALARVRSFKLPYTIMVPSSAFDRVASLAANPPEPTEALRALMSK